MYTCPMHPEIRKSKSGRCPECGMALVLESDSSTSHVSNGAERGIGKVTWKNYLPLIAIVSFIFFYALFVSLPELSLKSFIESFMAGFFITFAVFKLLDLKGFAQGYSTYDLIANRWFGYGYIYPFLELFFGLSMVVGFIPTWLLVFEIIVMTFSGVGVVKKLLKKEKFQCVCLGTFLKVPLTKITLVEDFGMAALALALLLS